MTDASEPLIDLILGTVGRTQELDRFLERLGLQSYRSFRLIVVDQSLDDRLRVAPRHAYENGTSTTRCATNGRSFYDFDWAVSSS